MPPAGVRGAGDACCGHLQGVLEQQAQVLWRTAAVLVVCLVALSAQVVAWGEVPGERLLLETVVERSGARAARVAASVDRGTSNGPLAVLTAAVVVVLVRHGRRRAALAVAASVMGVLAGNPPLKRLVDRPRPEQLSSLDGASALSFPSGHAAGTAAAAVAAVLVVRPRGRSLCGPGSGRRRRRTEHPAGADDACAATITVTP